MRSPEQGMTQSVSGAILPPLSAMFATSPHPGKGFSKRLRTHLVKVLTAFVPELHTRRWISKCRALTQASLSRVRVGENELVREDTNGSRFTVKNCVNSVRMKWSKGETHARQPTYCQLPGKPVVCTTGTGRVVIVGVKEYVDRRLGPPQASLRIEQSNVRKLK